MIYLVAILSLLLLLIDINNALTVQSIDECPTLSKRLEPITDIANLRVSDVDVIAGLGDSMMAGFGAKNINYDSPERYTPIVFFEQRGMSPIMGGDTDNNISTLAKIMKHYNPGMIGASVGYHLSSYCSDGVCKFPSSFWIPWKDNLNAALTGAIAKNMDQELDYLVPRMKTLLKDRFKNSWKIVNIEIGSNGQCDACNEKDFYDVTPDSYRESVIKAIERIRNEIPNVLINLLGVFRVSGIVDVRARQQDYCKPNLLTRTIKECDCLQQGESGLLKMDQQYEAYDKELQTIADIYAPLRNETFALLYNPSPINISSLPFDAISNIDCFHPNVKAIDWISKALWNQMYRSKDDKLSAFNYEEGIQVYCPSEDDRFF